MKQASEAIVKKIDYLLEKLMYIKHDAGNCACQVKKHKTLNHILSLLGFKKKEGLKMVNGAKDGSGKGVGRPGGGRRNKRKGSCPSGGPGGGKGGGQGKGRNR